ncbi:acetyl-CoA synthetase-like protein [Auriscalpium vulgare]|uniref:Acetyl-CoA synthetase-like protein n=1 Tax=Auriscalpium vulgare TaxID=40419 RepID=A0ACB8S2V6_9AGAM|nr:acetyl-CoA synthetase-like protein [Auriscalpium vulgare]
MKDPATFSLPPLDGNPNISQLLEYNATHNSEYPFYIFWDGSSIRTVTYAEVYRIVLRSASIVKQHFTRLQEQYALQEALRPPTRGPTIGILAQADTISYFATLFGALRLGLVAFPISPRNSPIAVAHLIRSSHVIQLFVSPDAAMQQLASDVVDLLMKEHVAIELLPIIQFVDVADGSTDPESIEIKKGSLEDDLILLHSSGSTAFPKIIPLTNRMVLQHSKIPFSGQVNLTGAVFSVHATPIFHIMGIVTVFMAASAGIILAVFPPSTPPVQLTPERCLEDALRAKCEYMYAVPSFIEAWSQDPTNLPKLLSLRGFLYSGAPLNKTIGDRLIKEGVRLFSLFGSTEGGCLSAFIPAEIPNIQHWNYFPLASHVEFDMIPQEGSDELFEPVIMATPTYMPCVINYERTDGRRGYRTGDILHRLPHDHNLWRVYGRVDEQIMLSNGEKTNPVPLETILARDPHISCALMFGRGHFQNGVLIQPTPAFAFDPENESMLSEFRNLIWPTVVKLNEYAPAHSRLFKEMILVSKPSKPFKYTAKGTPRRPAVLRTYEPEIEALYAAVQNASQTDIVPPGTWNEAETRSFLRAVVGSVLKSDIGDEDDLFLAGCDSLKATFIRNAIMYALRQTTNFPTTTMPNNFVYEHPTISSLSNFILNTLLRSGIPEAAVRKAKEQLMVALVKKYSANFPRHTPNSIKPRDAGEVVLITGTTGRLGCHLLAQLLSKPSVAKVIAVNRVGQADVNLRQREAFSKWGLDDSLVSSPILRLIGADVGARSLGLSEVDYRDVQDSVTSIIHNAWRVDFNVSLASFEPLIAGVRNLIDMALSSPHDSLPPILFTGSISVVPGQNKPLHIAEEALPDPSVAIGTGYGESKWVAESILLQAKRAANLRTTIVRVGQLSGDRARGIWSEKEWVAAMLRSSQALGCVPERDEMISWVPVDVAAASLLEMLGSREAVLHIVHPRPVHWSVFSRAAASLLHVEAVPYSDWLAKLTGAHKHSASDLKALEDIPALKLMDFFSNMPKPVEWSTNKAVDMSNALRSAEVLKGADVEKWVIGWLRKDFMKPIDVWNLFRVL